MPDSTWLTSVSNWINVTERKTMKRPQKVRPAMRNEVEWSWQHLWGIAAKASCELGDAVWVGIVSRHLFLTCSVLWADWMSSSLMYTFINCLNIVSQGTKFHSRPYVLTKYSWFYSWLYKFYIFCEESVKCFPYKPIQHLNNLCKSWQEMWKWAYDSIYFFTNIIYHCQSFVYVEETSHWRIYGISSRVGWE